MPRRAGERGEVLVAEDGASRGGDPVDVAAFDGRTWTGVHRGPPGEPSLGFNDTAPSGRDVVVAGLTIMSVDDDGALRVRRYVDWAGVFTQLGLTLNWRTPVAV